MIRLTQKQLEVLDFVQDKILIEGVSPTIKEIANGTDASISLTHRRVEALVVKGYLHRTGQWRKRAIRLGAEK